MSSSPNPFMYLSALSRSDPGEASVDFALSLRAFILARCPGEFLSLSTSEEGFAASLHSLSLLNRKSISLRNQAASEAFPFGAALTASANSRLTCAQHLGYVTRHGRFLRDTNNHVFLAFSRLIFPVTMCKDTSFFANMQKPLEKTLTLLWQRRNERDVLSGGSHS